MTLWLTESAVEAAALTWLKSAGWQMCNGAGISPGVLAGERDDYRQIVLYRRLRDALARHPARPSFRKLTQPGGADLIVHYRVLHNLLVDGLTVRRRCYPDSPPASCL